MESKIQHKSTYLQKRNRLGENRLVVAKGREVGGKHWEFGISRGKLVYIGWINNKVLLYSTGNYIQYPVTGTSLVVQWLRLHAPNAGGLGSIPGGGTRSHMPQLRVCMLQLKIPHAATEDPI